MALYELLSTSDSLRPASLFGSFLTRVGAAVALVAVLLLAGLVVREAPWVPAAVLAGAGIAVWCSQRPSRWVYLLTATIFLEASNLSLYVGPARVRAAQLLIIPMTVLVCLFGAGGLMRVRRIPLLIPLLLYLGCNFLSTLFGPVPAQSAKILMLLTSSVLVYVVTYLLARNDPAAWPSLFRFFVFVGLLQIGFGFYQLVAGYLNVKFGTGFRGDVDRIMRLLDVFTMPTRLPDGFGIVLIEAMLMGKPAIASRHGGPLDVVVDGETGFFVPPGDANSLAAKIIEILENPTLREEMGRKGRQRTLELFTIDRQVRTILRLYGEAAARMSR